MMRSKNALAKSIAGEIAFADKPKTVLKKWREIFGIRQKELAEDLGISASVISDYESGRRKSPGVGFVKRFVTVLISKDIERGGKIIKKFSSAEGPDAIVDIREFLDPVPVRELIETVDGCVVANEDLADGRIWGYTVIDSIKAILDLSEMDFVRLYGLTTERALIFTRVNLGRSPMIAIKVTQPKPSVVVMHGLNPKAVDKLAIKIADIEKIPLIISTLESEEELVSRLSAMRS